MNKKGQNGITLVALVITIIILLILAGVTIASLTGTGLFGKAKEAKNATDNATELENTRMETYENAIDEYLPNTTE